MQIKTWTLIGSLFFVALGCKSPEARSPVVHKSGHFLTQSVTRNKALQKAQEDQIRALIAADSLHTYHSSSEGFWYTYEKKRERDTIFPEFGDIVKFDYDISTLDGKTIYAKEEIGNRQYTIDQEDLFIGMRKGLKLMKTHEVVTFLFPSFVAFGYYGDGEKIKSNVPIKSTVTLKSITKHKDL